jgi:hypothetical protein
MNTGKRSINNRIHGNCRALFEQAKSDWTFEEIKYLMKCMAVENGYPSKTYKRELIGKEGTKYSRFYKVARSLSGQDDSVAMILNQTIQEFADANNFWLIEFDELENPYRTIGGRTKKEMIEYIDDLRKKGLIAFAQELEKSVNDD